MRGRAVSWLRALVGAIGAEVATIACAVGWVAVYSHLINAGQTLELYQAYAQRSAPWVAVIAGAPIFYAAGRWIARTRASALALFGVYLLLDASLIAFSGEPVERLPLGFIAASWLTKLIACYWGGSDGERTRGAAPLR